MVVDRSIDQIRSLNRRIGRAQTAHEALTLLDQKYRLERVRTASVQAFYRTLSPRRPLPSS